MYLPRLFFLRIWSCAAVHLVSITLKLTNRAPKRSSSSQTLEIHACTFGVHLKIVFSYKVSHIYYMKEKFSRIINFIRSAESEVMWKFLFDKVLAGWERLNSFTCMLSFCAVWLCACLSSSCAWFRTLRRRTRPSSGYSPNDWNLVFQLLRKTDLPSKDFVEGSVVGRVGSVGRVAWAHSFEWGTRFAAKLCGWVRKHLKTGLKQRTSEIIKAKDSWKGATFSSGVAKSYKQDKCLVIGSVVSASSPVCSRETSRSASRQREQRGSALRHRFSWIPWKRNLSRPPWAGKRANTSS